MRRLLLLLAMLLPTVCLAQPSAAPYDYAALSPIYRTLNSDQRALFDLLYDAAWYGLDEVTLPEGVLYDDAGLCMGVLCSDAP